MTIQQYAITPGSEILVTGANGFIASHVINLLLKFGFKVRGTVRTEKLWLKHHFDNLYGPDAFSTILVSDFEDMTAVTEAMNGVAGVIHIANDMSFSSNAQEVISRALNSTINVLKAASENSSIKRVVLTSSSAAAFNSEANVKVVIDENSWNTAAVDAAFDKSTDPYLLPFMVYGASKTEGEREAWKWVKENRPGFTFNTVLPFNTLGKILHPNIGGSSMSWMMKILEGDTSSFNLPPQWFVDVEDVARLHLVGLVSPKVESERIFAFAEPFNWDDIVRTLRKIQPKNKLIPEAPRNGGKALSEVPPAARAEQFLIEFFGLPGWTSLESSLRRGIDIE